VKATKKYRGAEGFKYKPLASKKRDFLKQLTNSRQRLAMTVFVALFAAAGISLLVLSQAATSVSSIKPGRWSDPTVWSTGRVPEVEDIVTIDHAVTYDLGSTSPVMGPVFVKGSLTFDPAKSSTLKLKKNMIVTGKLIMKPNSPSIEHFLQFTEVDESAFEGGGMPESASEVPATDVGLWVIQSGQLDIAGASKTSWTNATDTLAAGATSVTLKDAPVGWRVGDMIIITPTEAPTVGTASYDAVEKREITAISGNTVTFKAADENKDNKPDSTTAGLTRPHPKVNNLWTAEVGNLTRNVRIEGTSTPVPLEELEADHRNEDRHTGNSHIFIHSNVAQNISHAQLRYMGSTGTNERANDPMHEVKLGRYALHFHHNGGGSTGSVVDGVVVRDANFHQFVPHASDGITMKNNIAYDNKSGAFWWDPHDTDRNSDSHSTNWDHNLVARMRPRGDFIHSLGFFLPAGFDNKANNNTYVGALGQDEDYGGFVWVNGNKGVWVFDGNVAHNNNSSGIRVWQNSEHVHPITNFAIYHNQHYAMNHGAYFNDYTYVNGYVYGNKKGGLLLHSSAGSPVRQRYQNIEWDGAGISPNLVQAGHAGAFHGVSTLFINNTFKGYTQHAILIQGTGDLPKQLDLINPIFSGPSPAIFYGSDSSNSDNIVRVLPKPGEGEPYQIGPGNIRTTDNIQVFVPRANYGTGAGLLVEYFRGNNFDAANKIFARLEPTVSNNFGEDDDIPPPWLQPWAIPFMMRWSGEFEAQEDASYVFTAEEFFRARVWINDQEVLNADSFHRDQIAGSTINLRAGQRYRIRVDGNFSLPEHGIDTTYIFRLFVRKASDPASANMALPRSQLYCGSNPVCTVNPGPSATPSPAPSPSPTPPPPAPTPPPPAPDTTPPTVIITAPANNTSVSSSVNVTANAGDNVGVTQVEFLINGQIRSTDTTSPYGFSLSPSILGLSGGNHSLTARALDAAGNSTTSTPITIVVPTPTPPPAPPPTPPAPTCIPEDIDCNGHVNVFDYSILIARYGFTGSTAGRADINNDGRVNIFDFSQLLSKYGT
jgi:hypothetical protein